VRLLYPQFMLGHRQQIVIDNGTALDILTKIVRMFEKLKG